MAAQRKIGLGAARAAANIAARQFILPVQRRLAGTSPKPGGVGQVLQLRKIGNAVSREIEVQLAYLMDEVFDEDDPEYEAASKLFYRIDGETHDYQAKRWLEKAAATTNSNYFNQIATLIIEDGVRASFYPSSYSSYAKQVHATYDSNNTSHGMIWCPGYKVAPHYVQSTTIDHVKSVSHHWNTLGYQSDKSSRYQWYSDTSNHVYLCQSCNSSKGGQKYTKAPDYANGFSH